MQLNHIFAKSVLIDKKERLFQIHQKNYLGNGVILRPTPVVGKQLNHQQVSSVPKSSASSHLGLTNGSLSTTANCSTSTTSLKNGLGTGNSSFRHDDFLKKEYELARNQVIKNNDNNGNTNTNNTKNLTENNLKEITNSVSNNLINNNSSNKLVSINGTSNDDDELSEVRKKILKNKLNSPKLNGDTTNIGRRRKMMINGEHVNGEDDFKFIDSDDNSDKQKLSPPGSAGTTQKCLKHSLASTTVTGTVSKSPSPAPVTVSVNGSPTTSVTLSLKQQQQQQQQPSQLSQNQITKHLLNKSSTPPPLSPNVPATSSFTSNNKQPLVVVDNNNQNQSKKPAHSHHPADNNRVLIYNSATPVSKKKQLFISNNTHVVPNSTAHLNNSSDSSVKVQVQDPAKDQVTMVTIGGSRIKVITKDDSDDDTDVSTSATIILPTKPKSSVAIVQNGLPPSTAQNDENCAVTKTAPVVTNGECAASETTSSTVADLSSIFLEKKNQTNKLTDINDSVSYNFDLLCTFPCIPIPHSPTLLTFAPQL